MKLIHFLYDIQRIQSMIMKFRGNLYLNYEIYNNWNMYMYFLIFWILEYEIYIFQSMNMKIRYYSIQFTF